MEWSTAVNLIREDQWIGLQVGRAKQHSAHTRSLIVSSVLQRLSSQDRSGLAICVIGSLAREDMCKFSDIDLVILVSSLTEPTLLIEVKNICRMIGCISPVSTQIWDQSARMGEEDGLAFLFDVIDIKFLSGDRELYDQFRCKQLKILRQITGANLATLYVSERRQIRSYVDPSSALSSNLKRGLGGMIDCQYGKLVRKWSCHELRASNQRLFKVNEAVHSLVTAVRWYLHDHFGRRVQDYAWLRFLNSNLDGCRPNSTCAVDIVFLAVALKIHHAAINSIVTTLGRMPK